MLPCRNGRYATELYITIHTTFFFELMRIPNMITYLDRVFKEEQNDINLLNIFLFKFKNEIC